MLERAEPVLKVACVALAALLVFQGARVLGRLNPLPRTAVPAPPSWTAPTNSPAVTGSPGPGNPALAGPSAAPGPTGPGRRPPGVRPGRGPGRPGTPLPPLVQARVDRVVQSELIGQVMRPPPMALLGIAGSDVFLRAPNGQSGLVREGGELGGVTIVCIGTNRVLVREGDEEKELTIFEGMGGESLLPKPKQGTP